jgi:hypothetical protein
MLADLMKTSETQKRISERQERLLGQIGILDWQIKQLSAQQEAKYREIESMLREQPFIQQLELDLIDKYRDHPQQPPSSFQQAGAGPETISQNETQSPPGDGPKLAELERAAEGRTPAGRMTEVTDAVARAPRRSRKKVARELIAPRPKQLTRQLAKKAPAKKAVAPKPAPIQAAATTPPVKRGRGRPRRQPVAASPSPPVDISPMQPGNGANDLDAAFGAM